MTLLFLQRTAFDLAFQTLQTKKIDLVFDTLNLTIHIKKADVAKALS